MSFDKAAQRARAAQMEAGQQLPVAQPIPVIVKKTIKGFDGQDLYVGDTVAHATTSSNSISIRKRKITDIRDGRVFMDGNHQGAIASRLVKINY